jgi:hypothetical protein
MSKQAKLTRQRVAETLGAAAGIKPPRAPDFPRIGNRGDALRALAALIRKTRGEAARLVSVTGGPAALYNALEREII